MSPKSQRMERKSGEDSISRHETLSFCFLTSEFYNAFFLGVFFFVCRKNWTSSWTVLQGSSLLFAKGQGGSTSWVRIPITSYVSSSAKLQSLFFLSIPFISVLFLSSLFLHILLYSSPPCAVNFVILRLLLSLLSSPPLFLSSPEVLLPQRLHPRAAPHSS